MISFHFVNFIPNPPTKIDEFDEISLTASSGVLHTSTNSYGFCLFSVFVCNFLSTVYFYLLEKFKKKTKIKRSSFFIVLNKNNEKEKKRKVNKIHTL